MVRLSLTYFTLRLYHSRFAQPTGTATPTFWRWKNSEYDALVDQMGQTAPPPRSDPALGSEKRCYSIWLRELPPPYPCCNYQTTACHTTNLLARNWPSADNPYINTAYWHRTWLLVLLHLQPTRG